MRGSGRLRGWLRVFHRRGPRVGSEHRMRSLFPRPIFVAAVGMPTLSEAAPRRGEWAASTRSVRIADAIPAFLLIKMLVEQLPSPLLQIALTETLQYLQSMVEEGGLSRPPGRRLCSSYTAVETLWKVETTVSNV